MIVCEFVYECVYDCIHGFYLTCSGGRKCCSNPRRKPGWAQSSPAHSFPDPLLSPSCGPRSWSKHKQCSMNQTENTNLSSAQVLQRAASRNKTQQGTLHLWHEVSWKLSLCEVRQWGTEVEKCDRHFSFIVRSPSNESLCVFQFILSWCTCFFFF